MSVAARKPNFRLRNERLIRNWTQEESASALAHLCADQPRMRGEINAKMVSRWELGQNIPSDFYRKLLCSLYGKDPMDLGFLDQQYQIEAFVSRGGKQ